MDKSLKIVIVEDEVIIAHYLKMEMEFAGFTVIGIFSNGKDCINAIEGIDPDIILMDINLNGQMDGLETAKEILKIQDVNVIFMTGFSDNLLKEKALMLSPLAFLHKPVDADDIIPIIKKLS